MCLHCLQSGRRTRTDEGAIPWGRDYGGLLLQVLCQKGAEGYGSGFVHTRNEVYFIALNGEPLRD